MKRVIYMFALILCVGVIFTGCSPFESDGEVLIDASEVKVNLDYNEDLDLSNLIVKAKKGSSEVVLTTGTSETSSRIYSVDFGGFDKTKAGKYTITISYKDYRSASFVVKVNDKQIVGYELVGDFRTAYICNDKIDLKGAKLKVLYADNTSEEMEISTKDIQIGGYSFESAGQKQIVVTYNGQSYTINATVYDYKIESIKAVIPYKDKYYLGEEISLDGGKFEVVYENWTDAMDGILPTEISFDNPSVEIEGFDTTTVGKKIVTVKYFDKTKTYEINVEEPAVTSVTLVVAPKKVAYKINENLDLEGGYLQVGYAKEVSESLLPRRIELTDSRVEVVKFNSSAEGNSEVILKFKGFTVSYGITVEAPKMAGFIVLGLEKTTYALNESLDLIGGYILTIRKYTDNTSADGDKVTLENDYSAKGIVISGFDSSTVGKKTITVLYKGFSATFEIEVVANEN